jgi:SNF2 family DNA or RNA helicase
VKHKEVFKSFPYQAKALKKALKRGNGAFFFDPGLGKTKPSLDFMAIKKKRRVLIICPVSALGVWPDEIEKHLPNTKIEFKVYTFDKVKNKTLFKEIVKWKPDGIIVDESHYIKHHTSARSRTVHRLGDMIDDGKIILSGTPISKSPLNIYSQYRFLDKGIFGTRWADFRERFAVMGGYMNYKVVRIKNPKKLSEKIRSLATRAKNTDRPEPTWQIIPVELDTKSRRIYQRMEKESVVQFKSGKISTAEIGATKLIRFQQITGGFLKSEEGDYVNVNDNKYVVLGDLLDNLVSRKLVIFARFLREIKQIKKTLKTRGFNVLTIHGGTGSNKRESKRRLFSESVNHNVLVMQIGAAQSIDLTSASIAIYFSMDYSVEHFQQSQGRIDRVNQEEHCTYYILACRNTVDYSIYELLKHNINVSELMLDRYEEIIEGSLRI